MLDVLDFEKSALMLVMGSPGIRPPALRRLAVAEVEEVWLRWSSVSSESEHGLTLRGFRREPLCAFGYLSLRTIGDPGRAENPPIR